MKLLIDTNVVAEKRLEVAYKLLNVYLEFTFAKESTL
jgi:hypothetical protein